MARPLVEGGHSSPIVYLEHGPTSSGRRSFCCHSSRHGSAKLSPSRDIGFCHLPPFGRQPLCCHSSRHGSAKPSPFRDVGFFRLGVQAASPSGRRPFCCHSCRHGSAKQSPSRDAGFKWFCAPEPRPVHVTEKPVSTIRTSRAGPAPGRRQG